jgi:hypothetical protein
MFAVMIGSRISPMRSAAAAWRVVDVDELAVTVATS